MSHPLGSLAEDMTQLVRYTIGEDAEVAGLRLAEQQRWAEAAGQFEVSARVAAVLAEASVSAEPARASHWRQVCTARRKLGAEAREAGGCKTESGARYA